MTNELNPDELPLPDDGHEIQVYDAAVETRRSRVKRVIGGSLALLVCVLSIALLIPCVPGSGGATQSAKTESQRRRNLIDVALQTEAANAENCRLTSVESDE